MTVFFSKKNNIKNSLSFLITHFLHCFKQFKKLLKTVFLEEARYFAGLFFSVRSYRQVNTQVKAEKEEEKREKQQAILPIAAKSVDLLRKEYELKKVNEALEHVQRRKQEQAKINQAD